jgi:hypothetical protein
LGFLPEPGRDPPQPFFEEGASLTETNGREGDENLKNELEIVVGNNVE